MNPFSEDRSFCALIIVTFMSLCSRLLHNKLAVILSHALWIALFLKCAAQIILHHPTFAMIQ